MEMDRKGKVHMIKLTEHFFLLFSAKAICVLHILSITYNVCLYTHTYCICIQFYILSIICDHQLSKHFTCMVSFNPQATPGRRVQSKIVSSFIPSCLEPHLMIVFADALK